MTISAISSHDELQVFNFNGMQLRGLLIDGEPWFIALDLANILEYRMTSDMTRLVGDEDKGTHPVRTLGGVQNLAVISEPAFYQIVVQRQSGRLQKKSSREMIQQFQRWVTHVVLPDIRKTGGYNTESVKELTGAELMAKALIEAQSVLAQKDERIAQLEPAATAYGHWNDDNLADFTFRALSKKLIEYYPGMTETKLREHMLKRRELGRVYYYDKKKDERIPRYVPNTEMMRRGWATERKVPSASGRLISAYKYTPAYYEELVKRFSKTLTSAGQQELLEVA